MSKSKDKRIKKLKRKRIWPSVLGLFLVVFIFLILFAMVSAFSILDVMQRKLTEGEKQAAQIASFYEEYGMEGTEQYELLQQSVLAYLELNSQAEAVVILDADNNKLWSSSSVWPNMQNAYSLNSIQEGRDYGVQIVIEEDMYQFFEVEDNTLSLGTDFFDHINFSQIFGKNVLFGSDESLEILYYKIWYVFSVEDNYVCVLSRIGIYDYDLLAYAICFLLFAVLINIFVLYYAVSFIGFIISMRKTTKIIYTDMVTGGDNWLHFVKKGTFLLKRNRKGQYNYAMIHLKMRKYRSFCTCFGVREAEELVEKFYAVIRKHLKRKETVALHEKAEFGILLIYTDLQDLDARIKKLEQALDAVLPSIKLHFSSGVYLVQPGEKDVELLYNNALLAREMSGEDTENSIAFYNIEMNKQRLWERKVEDDMERALVNKEFKLYLQPKISTVEEQLAGAEALVRWIHPTEGFIPPNKFIPIFEQNGFILKLDDYMLEEVSRQQSEWIEQGRKIVPISVNISRAHFTRENLAEHIVEIVDKYGVPHSVIELELTESAFFDDKQTLLNTVKSLREAGFLVSMDDFGAGYSSLNSLKELHLDILKIDADFFRGVGEEERGMLIVSEVIDLAKKLDMKIVAEGIESREQVDFLTEQECDLIQGYFFAKPMPINEFEEKYKEN